MPGETFTEPGLEQAQCLLADVQSWVEPDSFVSPSHERERERQRLVELNTQVVQVAENTREVEAMMASGAASLGEAEQHTAQAAAKVGEGVGELRTAAKAKRRLLPMKVAGTCGMVGGAIGGAVGLAPGAALGAAVGSAVGAFAGSVAKGVSERRISAVETADPRRSREQRRGLRRCASADAVLTTRRSSWQEDAGREWGPERYCPGDVVRTLTRQKSWKAKSGRNWGGDGYQLFDVARTVKRAVFRPRAAAGHAPAASGLPESSG